MSEIAFRFREPLTRLFHRTPLAQAEPNWLVFRLNRPEGIDAYLQAEQPGDRPKSSWSATERRSGAAPAGTPG